MGSAFHQLCPRYSGTLTPTARTANRLSETFTFTLLHACINTINLIFSSKLLIQGPSEKQSFALVLHTILLTAEITMYAIYHLATNFVRDICLD